MNDFPEKLHEPFDEAGRNGGGPLEINRGKQGRSQRQEPHQWPVQV